MSHSMVMSTQHLISAPPVPFPNAFWVIPGSLLAGEYPGDRDDQIALRKLSCLLDVGVRTVINLMDEYETQKSSVVPAYHISLRSLAQSRCLDLAYMRIPVLDRSVPSVGVLRHILDLLDRSRAGENATFVHCWAGRGRTGTVIGCYLRRHRLATAENVLDTIAELRKGIPSADRPCPDTEMQIQMVKNWNAGE